jgi:hydroxyethylthiazole kinase-like uncharacterized protein yjeF
MSKPLAHSRTRVLTGPEVRRMIPARPKDSHKGSNGHALIVAGSCGMSGAAVLSALGALKAGVGLLTVAIVESERAVLIRRVPEALTLGLPETRQGTLAGKAWDVLRQYLSRRPISVIALGPGLSLHPAVRKVVRSILKNWRGPLVLDADGLNNVSPCDVQGHPGLIMTPHPGEMARFLGVARASVQRDRGALAARVARRLGVVCVLKGYRTVISDGKHTRINPTGNPAMAAGGMGDVLTGMIAGFLAQGLDRFEAACAGVYLHGLAGDLARVADRGLLASELAAKVPAAIRKLGD